MFPSQDMLNVLVKVEQLIRREGSLKTKTTNSIIYETVLGSFLGSSVFSVLDSHSAAHSTGIENHKLFSFHQSSHEKDNEGS